MLVEEEFEHALKKSTFLTRQHGWTMAYRGRRHSADRGGYLNVISGLQWPIGLAQRRLATYVPLVEN